MKVTVLLLTFLIVLLPALVYGRFSPTAAQDGHVIVIAHRGQDVELLCNVTENSAALTVAWLINNMGPYGVNAILNGLLTGYSANLDTNSLIIQNITTNDIRNGSEYWCVIVPVQSRITIADIRNESDPTILYVAVFLEITVHPDDNGNITVAEGSNLTLRCEAIGDGVLYYQWGRESRSLPNNAIEKNIQNMTFSAIKVRNEGQYYCQVSNERKRAISRSVQVTVRRVPSINNSPRNQRLTTFSGNEQVTLTCKVTGDDIVGGYWERVNDDPLPANNNQSSFTNNNRRLTINIIRTRPEHSGKYRCVVYSQWGVAQSRNVRVTITNLFVAHPTDASAAALFNAVFSCSAQAYVNPTITWYRSNRNPIPDKALAIETSSANVATSILTIPNVTSEDVGLYYCEVRANRKTAISQSANLFLADSPSPPTVVTNPLVNLTVNDYNLTMTCLPNITNFNYKWIRRNNVLPSRAQNVNSPQMTIVNLRPEDSGDYQCITSNGTGTISSNFSTVNITVSLPIISEHPVDVKRNVLQSASFKCSAYGFGVVKIAWKRVKHNMPITAKVTVKKQSLNNITSILRITKIVGYYSGQYYCVAENKFGKVVSQTANLNIRAPRPEIIISPENVTVLPNQSFTMSCLASSFGLFKCEWRKREGILPPAAVKSYVHNILFNTRSNETTSVCSLVVSKVQPSDEGWYCCEATSIGGSTIDCAWLEVNTAPNITTQPVSTTIKAGKLNIIALSCVAVGMGPIYYKWEKYNPSNNSWVSLSNRTVRITSPSLKFNIITEEDEGVYRCIAYNNDGSVTSDNATLNVYVTIKPCLPLLDAPENGTRDIVKVDGITKQISFRCNPNYVLKGNDSATCVDGEWSTPVPTCDEQ